MFDSTGIDNVDTAASSFKMPGTEDDMTGIVYPRHGLPHKHDDRFLIKFKEQSATKKTESLYTNVSWSEKNDTDSVMVDDTNTISPPSEIGASDEEYDTESEDKVGSHLVPRQRRKKWNLKEWIEETNDEPLRSTISKGLLDPMKLAVLRCNALRGAILWLLVFVTVLYHEGAVVALCTLGICVYKDRIAYENMRTYIWYLDDNVMIGNTGLIYRACTYFAFLLATHYGFYNDAAIIWAFNSCTKFLHAVVTLLLIEAGAHSTSKYTLHGPFPKLPIGNNTCEIIVSFGLPRVSHAAEILALHSMAVDAVRYFFLYHAFLDEEWWSARLISGVAAILFTGQFFPETNAMREAGLRNGVLGRQYLFVREVGRPILPFLDLLRTRQKRIRLLKSYDPRDISGVQRINGLIV